MWRIVKAEVFYRIWRSLGTYLLFWAFTAVMLYGSSGAFEKHIASHLTLILMTGIILPFWMITYNLLTQEFKENRIRFMMMLPLCIRSVGNLRLIIASSFLLPALPFCVVVLLPLKLFTGWAFVWLIISIMGLTLGGVLYNQIMNELQYLPGSHKVLTMFIYWSNSVFFILILLACITDPAKPIFWFLLRQIPTPWGAAIATLIAVVILRINRDLFTNRVNYADIHQPERNILDFIRTFRGQKTYRNQL